jgi:hypothetical protein
MMFHPTGQLNNKKGSSGQCAFCPSPGCDPACSDAVPPDNHGPVVLLRSTVGERVMWQFDFSHRCHVSFYLSTLPAIVNDAKKVMWQRGNRGNLSPLAQPGIARYHKKMLCKLLCKCATPLPHSICLSQYASGHAAIQANSHIPDEPQKPDEPKKRGGVRVEGNE